MSALHWLDCRARKLSVERAWIWLGVSATNCSEDSARKPVELMA